jgi:CRP-like cAMP-binding protein
MLENLTLEERKLFKTEIYHDHQIIVHEQEICTQVHFILEGEVIISSLTLDGYESIINHLSADEVFGNALIFAKNNAYLGDIMAVTKTTCLVINKENLIYLLMHNQQFLGDYISRLSLENIANKMMIKVLSKNSLKEKIIAYIDMFPQDEVYIKSISHLASILSLPRESVSRIIHELMSEGMIIYQNKIIKLIK